MSLMDSEREKELRMIRENLVAQNIAGLYKSHLGQMGCKEFAATSLGVIYSLTPNRFIKSACISLPILPNLFCALYSDLGF